MVTVASDPGITAREMTADEAIEWARGRDARDIAVIEARSGDQLASVVRGPGWRLVRMTGQDGFTLLASGEA